MKAEVQCTITFLLEQLSSKIPAQRRDPLAEELHRSLVDKFSGHWYPESPCKGSGYRCLRVGTREMDAAVGTAIQRSGLEASQLTEALPHELSIWVDPGEVSYRMGEKGTVTVIYQEKRGGASAANNGIRSAGPGHVKSEPDLTGSGRFSFNPEAEDFLPMTMDSLSSSMRGISLSPVSALHGFHQPMVALGLAHHHQQQQQQQQPALVHPQALHPLAPPAPAAATGTGAKPRLPPAPPTAAAAAAAGPLSRPSSLTFTAASFAQTKFGSTKLKSAGKKVNFQQLSPTEFANYMRQRSAMKGFRGQTRSPVGSARGGGGSGGGAGGAGDFPLFQAAKEDGFGYWGEAPLAPSVAGVSVTTAAAAAVVACTSAPLSYSTSSSSSSQAYDTHPGHPTTGHDSWDLPDNISTGLPSSDQYGQQSLIAAN